MTGPETGANDTLVVLKDGSSARELAPLVYDNLRRLAASRMSSDWTCQPTAIVHEVYLRLADQSRTDWRGRTHFMAIGAEMVRRVIADEARRRSRQKRGGDGAWQRITLDNAAMESGTGPIDVLAMEDALARLAELDPRACRVVELRFYGGLTDAEAAAVLGVSERTIRNDWRAARAWLRRELAENGGAFEGG